MGIAVFVLVESALIFAVFKFRARPGAPPRRPDARQLDARDHLDDHPGDHPRLHRRAEHPDDLPDAGEAPADALQVEVIGHQWWWEFRYPAVQLHHGERALPPDRPHGELHAQDAGRAALVLDPAAQRQARPDLEPHEPSLVHAGLASARTTASAPSSAARRTRTCASRCSSWAPRSSRSTSRTSRPGPVFPVPVDSATPRDRREGREGRSRPHAAAPLPAAMRTPAPGRSTSCRGTSSRRRRSPPGSTDTLPGDAARGAAALQDRRLHRLPHREGRLLRRHRPEPDARRQPHDDRERALPERPRAPRRAGSRTHRR